MLFFLFSLTLEKQFLYGSLIARCFFIFVLNWTLFVVKQRFLASEFGHDIDRAEPVEPGLSMYMEKRRVRRFIEEAGIPYTHICCNSIAAWPYHDNTHPADVLPPLDCFHIYGDGSVKGMHFSSLLFSFLLLIVGFLLFWNHRATLGTN